jgi:hypothetical protein
VSNFQFWQIHSVEIRPEISTIMGVIVCVSEKISLQKFNGENRIELLENYLLCSIVAIVLRVYNTGLLLQTLKIFSNFL